jgi:hypothetical protein
MEMVFKQGTKMKVRTNRHRTLAMMARNKKHSWFVAPFVKQAFIKYERNQRIKALVDKAFPP